RSLTDSQKVNGIYMYLTELSRKEMQNKGGLVKIVRYSKEHPWGAIFNYYLMIINGGASEAKPMTNSNSNKDKVLIKNTEYYQPVKKILDSKLSNK
ncbi:hypothetical protein AB4F11_07510, partial [Francisella philomiragia]